MTRRLCAAVALAVVLVAGCGGSDDDTATPSSTELTAPSTPAPATSAPATTSTSTTTTLAATTTIADSTLPATTLDPAVDPAVAGLVLSGQGIGSAEFGSEPEEVISYISSFIGEPTNDTGWIDPLSVGTCPGTEIRLVDWGMLSLAFGDASQVRQDGRHFFAYYYGSAGELGGEPVGLATEAGITTGSQVSEVVAAYPGVSVIPEDDVSAPFFYVDDNLRGYVTGVEDDSTVTVILGGIGCSD